MEESLVYLKKTDANQFVEARLCDEITDEHLSLWHQTGVPVMEAHCHG